MYSVRRQQAIDDYKVYGNFQKGIYKGIKWEAKRNEQSPPFSRKEEIVYSPNNYDTFYWKAYVIMTDGTFKKKYKNFTGISNTFRQDFSLEICFNRECDYPWGNDKNAEYRDFPFILNVIKNTIDKIILDQVSHS